MQIIVTHDITDLDGLAAMIAAGKLYPEAKPVFVGRQHKLVKNFMALYRDEFNVSRLQDIAIKQVDQLIIVDTHNPERLGRLKEKIDIRAQKIILYDHHPHDRLDWVNSDFSREVGSVTTILVEKLDAAQIDISPLEATLFALGIYADTGRFTHLNTTVDDVSCLAGLLARGANLKIINEFLRDQLNSNQQKMFNHLINKREDISVNGVEVTLCYLEYHQYVRGLNSVIEKIKSAFSLVTVFIAVFMEDKTVIIGRSSDEAVDVGRICALFGGGGHSGAGSATVEENLNSVVRRLKKYIRYFIRPRQLVRDRMSSPVITIKPETTIADAEKKMNRYGHNGLVVIDANKVQGVFSRRDLAKVKDHNLMNAPVKGYMSRKVITIEPDTPVDRARELMVEYNIGRLPVVKKGKLKGIITRSDILATYYKEESPRSLLNHYGASLVEFQENVMDISGQLTILPEKVVSILQTVGKTGASCDSRVFLIGGMVRDIFTGRENTDLDFVVEENLRELLPMAAEKLQGEWSYNEEFQTGQIKLQGELNLDFALTRSERYPYPGSLPRVEKADIFTDLFRRDFTINALALGITPGEWGTLYDFFGGKEDINHRLLRALHRFSFLDDPTRIIRGLELANRLDFEFEEETATLMQEALERGNFKQLSTSRLLKELQKLFTSDINNNFFQLLRKYPVYKLLDTKLELTSETESRLKKLASWIDYLNEKDYNIKKWLLILYLLLDKNYKNTRQRLENHLTRNESEILNFSPSTVAEKILLSSDDPVNITRILDNLKPEEIILLLLDKNNKDVTDIIIHYLDHLCDIELEIDGHDLQNLGLQQGPEIKKILQELLRQKMKGKVNSRQEELDLAKKIIKDKH